MSIQPWLTFKPPPSSVASSGTADSYQFVTGAAVATTATLAADNNWTSSNTVVNAPALALTSTSPTGGFQIRPAADAANPIYIGIDNTVSVATGVPIYPGERFQCIGYTGPVWVIGPPGLVAPYFYRVP